MDVSGWGDNSGWWGCPRRTQRIAASVALHPAELLVHHAAGRIRQGPPGLLPQIEAHVLLRQPRRANSSALSGFSTTTSRGRACFVAERAQNRSRRGHLLGRAAAEDAVGPRGEDGDRVRSLRATALNVSGAHRLSVSSSAMRSVLAGVGRGGLVGVRAPRRRVQSASRGAPDRGIGAEAVANAVAGVEASSRAMGPLTMMRTRTCGCLADPVQVVDGVRGPSLPAPREVRGQAAAHHGVDGELLDGKPRLLSGEWGRGCPEGPGRYARSSPRRAQVGSTMGRPSVQCRS
jgi:hypothetical protein